MKTLKNKKLMTEFMGYKLSRCNNGLAWESPYKKAIDDKFKLHGRLWNPEDSYYKWNSSWDWLMPVAHKCLEIHDAYLSEDIQPPYNKIVQGLINVSIEETYESIVEFIEWYNEIKEQLEKSVNF